MKPDSELLRQYIEHGDEAAFAEVVRRHVNLVYATAVRLLNGDATLAEDVTQTVFTGLAHKADTLFSNQTVAGWLHHSVRFAAANAVRTEQRRRAHEQESSTMTDQTISADNSWTQLRPLLDEAVAQLGDEERDAVLLRFFEDKTHREVGEALGLNENAARMRVERAIEKLRSQFARYGVKTTAALLTTTLGAKAASLPAPATFASSVAGNSLTQAAAQGAAGITTTTASTTTTAAPGLTSSFLAKALVVVLAAALVLFFLTFKPVSSSAGNPIALAATPVPAPLKAALNNPLQQPAPAPKIPPSAPAPVAKAVPAPPVPAVPGTQFGPTQPVGNPPLYLFNGSSEDIAAAKSVMADIARLFHAGDMAAFTDLYILPKDRAEVKEMMERMQNEPPDQQYRWQTVLNALDVLQDQTPGFTKAGVPTFDDQITYGNYPLIQDNWVSLKKQDGQWYLDTGSAIDFYQGSHLH